MNECKKITLSCPVDVYVYDKDDNLCGAIVNGEVNHSVIFSGAEIKENAKVSESVIMNDAVIGEGAVVDRCLVADGVRVPDGMVLGNKENKEILLVSKSLIAKAGEENE